MKKILFIFLYTLAFGLLSKFIYSEYREVQKKREDAKGGVKKAMVNYQKDVQVLAKKFNLAPSYLMALIMLESSGKKSVPVRYEKGIYKQLLDLKKGRIKKFENLRRNDVRNLTKKQLKELSSSYGPFQIMGYKSFILNISLDKLKGNKNMYYAVKWINLTYGDYVRNKDYKHAFHIHNAGKTFPENGKTQTHDPNYVKNGLRYEKYFRKVIFKD